MQPHSLLQRPVGELAAEDYRRTRVFNRFGIDFCCGGGISLERACERKQLPKGEVVAALQEIGSAAPGGDPPRVQSWSDAFLIEYIISVHHRFVRESLPALKAFTGKVAGVHGHASPEVVEVARIVEDLHDELFEHMRLEEEDLFPALLAKAENAADRIRAEEDHQAAGRALERLKEITNDYTPPEWACTTYRAAYANLAEFDHDLRAHIHLENNVLFPRHAQG